MFEIEIVYKDQDRDNEAVVDLKPINDALNEAFDRCESSEVKKIYINEDFNGSTMTRFTIADHRI